MSSLRRVPALFVVLILVLLTAGCSLLPEERVEVLPTLIEPPPSRVVTYAVESTRIVEEMRGLARVAPTLETNLYFKQNGRLAALHVQPGEQVKAGQLLAQLETGNLDHQLALAEIDLEMNELRLAATRTGGTPVDIRLQELTVEKSRLQVNDLKQRIELTTIRAPHDGIVQSLRLQVGQMVQEFNTVMIVADPQSRELQLELRRSDEVNKLSRGGKALVEVRRDQWVPATISQITQKEEGIASVTYVVHLELDGGLEASGLRLGDLVSVRLIVQEKEDTLVIPRAALREFMGRRYVRVIEGDARREVDVEVGIMTPTHVEILKGLSAGDLVIGQ